MKLLKYLLGVVLSSILTLAVLYGIGHYATRHEEKTDE